MPSACRPAGCWAWPRSTPTSCSSRRGSTPAWCARGPPATSTGPARSSSGSIGDPGHRCRRDHLRRAGVAAPRPLPGGVQHGPGGGGRRRGARQDEPRRDRADAGGAMTETGSVTPARRRRQEPLIPDGPVRASADVCQAAGCLSMESDAVFELALRAGDRLRAHRRRGPAGRLPRALRRRAAGRGPRAGAPLRSRHRRRRRVPGRGGQRPRGRRGRRPSHRLRPVLLPPGQGGPGALRPGRPRAGRGLRRHRWLRGADQGRHHA